MTGLESIITDFTLTEKERREHYPASSLAAFLKAGSFAAGYAHIVILNENGTVAAAGDNQCGQCNVNGWRDIVKVAAGDYHTLGLKKDGTVVAAGDNRYGQCSVEHWRGITQIFADKGMSVGIRSDGTVLVNQDNSLEQKSNDTRDTSAELKKLIDTINDFCKQMEPTPAEEFTYVPFGGGIMITKNLSTRPVIVIPETIDGLPVTQIGQNAFRDCKARSIVLPSSLLIINSCAFQYCYALETVRIPDKVNHVGSYAFDYCSGLKEVTLPDSLDYLGRSAFKHCPSLKRVLISDTTKNLLGKMALRAAFDSLSVLS